MWTILSSIEGAYLVTLIVYIVLEKRSPASTLAWIFALAFFPVVGFAVYFVIGPRRLHRKRLRHAKSRDLARGGIDRGSGTFAVHELPWRTQIVRLVTKASGAPLRTCKDVRVLIDGPACMDAICEAIAQAKHHVHVEYYIFDDDEVGRRVQRALIERANAGVKVRLLVDAVGSPLGYRFRRELSDAHVEFARFNPLIFGSVRPRINFRTHRKIVVVDGQVGFCGGINIGVVHAGYRDTHLRLEGTAVRELQLAFLEDWHYATAKMPDREGLFPRSAENEPELVQVVASGPDQEWESMQQLFFSAITLAEEKIEITTPYFVPDEPIFTALMTAALRGVKVDIVVPERSDSRVVTAAARSYFDDLVRAGAHVWEYPAPPMVHAKTMVIDGKMGIVGSANMDNRSFRLNFEIGACFYHVPAIEVLERQFQMDVAKSRKVTPRARHKIPISARLFEGVARLLSPLL